MKREDLFESMEGIEERILRRSEKATGNAVMWKELLAVAACFCLVLTALIVPGSADPVLPDRPTQEAEPTEPWQWIPVYNSGSASDTNANVRRPPGLFWEHLSRDKLAALMPSVKMDWMRMEGRGFYLNDGTPYYMVIDIATRGSKIQLVMGEYDSCVIYDKSTAEVTQYGDVEYRLYRTDRNERNFSLEATAVICDVPMHFSVFWATEEDLADFETVLQCFAYYTEGKPSLADAPPDEIPEFADVELTLQEAYVYETFSKYLPENIPEEMTIVKAERYKESEADFLKVSWRTPAGDTYLEWAVHTVEKFPPGEYPDVAELTLEDLQEQFERRYSDFLGSAYLEVEIEDMVLQISAKNISAQWVYERLIAIRERVGAFE